MRKILLDATGKLLLFQVDGARKLDAGAMKEQMKQLVKTKLLLAKAAYGKIPHQDQVKGGVIRTQLL